MVAFAALFSFPTWSWSRHAASVFFTFCRPSVDLECISSFDIPTTEGIIVGSGNQTAHIHGLVFAYVLYLIEAQVVPSDVRTSAVFHVLYEGMVTVVGSVTVNIVPNSFHAALTM